MMNNSIKLMLGFILVFIVLSVSFSSAKINEKELKSNIKETLIEEGLKQTGVIDNISQEMNKSNPETVKNLDAVCQKTDGARDLIFILTILSILGFLTIPSAGLIGLIIDVLAILNYFCLLT